MRKTLFPLLAILCCQFSLSFAQTATTTPTDYDVYAYIKVKPGMGKDYLLLEKAWKKIHAAKKKGGQMDGWALLEVLSPSGANTEYNYIARNSFKGDEQLAGYFDGKYMPDDWKTLLTADEIALVDRSNEIRTVVKNEVWSHVDKVMADKITPNSISVFNYFSLNEGKTSADHYKMERDIWKPIHAARIKDGAMDGWLLMHMEMPFGASMPYSIGTIDIYKDMKSYLAPWFDVYFKKVYPTKKAADLIKQSDASKLIKGDLRKRIDVLD
jgi:hypothetical protein